MPSRGAEQRDRISSYSILGKVHVNAFSELPHRVCIFMILWKYTKLQLYDLELMDV